MALTDLGVVWLRRKNSLAAIYCLATAAWIDKANPNTMKLLLPLLGDNGFKSEARQLSSGGSVTTANKALGKLPLPSGRGRKISARSIHIKCVQSVVLIKVGNATGTGVCVGKPGIILTNDHVIEGHSTIKVHPFVLRSGKARRLRALQATVVYRNSKVDIAVLKVSSPPSTLRPLLVEGANPQAGEVVYAIGHPGLGDKVLTQTISQGIVSAAARTLQGVTYTQHTAAINPGNSGGPLLNDRGRVVGMNTLKARLEGVNFSIPAETIRAAFAGGGK
jgi:S1-C subfamily serine protease